jgi:hypothetical protein
MDALELSLRCSSLLVRSTSNKSSGVQDTTANHETQWSEADYEKHFTDHGKSTHAGFLMLSGPYFGACTRIKTVVVCSVLKSN